MFSFGEIENKEDTCTMLKFLNIFEKNQVKLVECTIIINLEIKAYEDSLKQKLLSFWFNIHTSLTTFIGILINEEGCR